MAVTKRTPPNEERATESVSERAPQPEPTAPTTAISPVAPPPAPEPPVKATYRVWPYGTLQHNGKTYQPGTVLVMRIEDASKVPCLEKVDG